MAYVTLAIAFVAEGTSLARAFWQVRGEARRRHEEVLDHVEIQPRHQRQGGPVRGQRRGDRPDTAEIESRPGVDALLELCTMHMGPDSLIVAARVALNDKLGADQAEDLADDIDSRLTQRLPLQPHVFIDPTQAGQTPRPEAPRARRHHPWRPGRAGCPGRSDIAGTGRAGGAVKGA